MAKKPVDPAAVAQRKQQRVEFVQGHPALRPEEARQQFYVQTRSAELTAAGKEVDKAALRQKFQSGGVTREGFYTPGDIKRTAVNNGSLAEQSASKSTPVIPVPGAPVGGTPAVSKKTPTTRSYGEETRAAGISANIKVKTKTTTAGVSPDVEEAKRTGPKKDTGIIASVKRNALAPEISVLKAANDMANAAARDVYNVSSGPINLAAKGINKVLGTNANPNLKEPNTKELAVSTGSIIASMLPVEKIVSKVAGFGLGAEAKIGESLLGRATKITNFFGGENPRLVKEVNSVVLPKDTRPFFGPNVAEIPVVKPKTVLRPETVTQSGIIIPSGKEPAASVAMETGSLHDVKQAKLQEAADAVLSGKTTAPKTKVKTPTTKPVLEPSLDEPFTHGPADLETSPMPKLPGTEPAWITKMKSDAAAQKIPGTSTGIVIPKTDVKTTPVLPKREFVETNLGVKVEPKASTASSPSAVDAKTGLFDPDKVPPTKAGWEQLQSYNTDVTGPRVKSGKSAGREGADPRQVVLQKAKAERHDTLINTMQKLIGKEQSGDFTPLDLTGVSVPGVKTSAKTSTAFEPFIGPIKPNESLRPVKTSKLTPAEMEARFAKKSKLGEKNAQPLGGKKSKPFLIEQKKK